MFADETWPSLLHLCLLVWLQHDEFQRAQEEGGEREKRKGEEEEKEDKEEKEEKKRRRRKRLGAAGGEPSKHVREANVLGRRENCSNGDSPNAFFRDCSISFRSRLVDACKLLSLGKHHNLSLVPTFPVFNATNEALLHVLYSQL